MAAWLSKTSGDYAKINSDQPGLMIEPCSRLFKPNRAWKHQYRGLYLS